MGSLLRPSNHKPSPAQPLCQALCAFFFEGEDEAARPGPFVLAAAQKFSRIPPPPLAVCRPSMAAATTGISRASMKSARKQCWINQPQLVLLAMAAFLASFNFCLSCTPQIKQQLMVAVSQSSAFTPETPPEPLFLGCRKLATCLGYW